MTPKSSGATFNGQGYHYALKSCIAKLASKEDLSIPLHVSVHVCRKHKIPDLSKLLVARSSLVPIGWQIWDLPIDHLWRTFRLAYDHGAVIHFSNKYSAHHHNGTANPQALRTYYLAAKLGWVLEIEKQGSQESPGHLFLCDVPSLVLDPIELVEAAENAKEVVRLRLFDLFKVSLPGTPARGWSDVQKWNHYVSRVTFVDSGFRLSDADMAASVKRRSVEPPIFPGIG